MVPLGKAKLVFYSDRVVKVGGGKRQRIGDFCFVSPQNPIHRQVKRQSDSGSFEKSPSVFPITGGRHLWSEKRSARGGGGGRGGWRGEGRGGGNGEREQGGVEGGRKKRGGVGGRRGRVVGRGMGGRGGLRRIY